LQIKPTRSSDPDNSEILSLSFLVERDSTGFPIGTLSISDRTTVPGISFESLGDGLYTLYAEGETSTLREAAMQLVLSNGVVFFPRGDARGDFPAGIIVTATSTETSAYELIHCL